MLLHLQKRLREVEKELESHSRQLQVVQALVSAQKADGVEVQCDANGESWRVNRSVGLAEVVDAEGRAGRCRNRADRSCMTFRLHDALAGHMESVYRLSAANRRK